MTINDLLKINSVLEEGCRVMIRLFCNRCFKDLGGFSNDTHNSGNIRKILLGPKDINIEYINNWINDLEHGLFHGIMACLVLFLHDYTLIDKLNKSIENYDKEPNEYEILFTSIILHDFYRTAHNVAENHDELLIEYFPQLRKSTYIHSNPSTDYFNDYLIIADRLELYRYEDVDEWLVKDSVFEKYLNNYEWSLHSIFYKNVRPALYDLYLNKNERWIRHGIENKTRFVNYEKNYPSEQNTNDVRKDDSKFSWSIELSHHPFDGCLTNNTHHDSHPPKFNNGTYTTLYGIIPLKKYKSVCGENLILCTITPDPNKKHIGKDHFCCQGKIPLNIWNFIYSDKLKNDTHLTKQLTHLFETNKIKITSHNLGKLVLTLSEKIIDNILALRAKY